jgi:hypothetical protein
MLLLQYILWSIDKPIKVLATTHKRMFNSGQKVSEIICTKKQQESGKPRRTFTGHGVCQLQVNSVFDLVISV